MEFELFHESYKLGISQRRAEWFCRWCKEMSVSESVNTAVFEEGLGRMTYVTGALEYERAFLSPLYKLLTLHPRGSIRCIPSYVRFIPRYLASEVEKCRTYRCAVEMRDHMRARNRCLVLLRVDSKGRFLMYLRTGGHACTSDFAVGSTWASLSRSSRSTVMNPRLTDQRLQSRRQSRTTEETGRPSTS